MHLGQAQVEDEQVKFVGGHQGGVGFGAGGHMIDRRTGGAQRSQ